MNKSDNLIENLEEQCDKMSAEADANIGSYELPVVDAIMLQLLFMIGGPILLICVYAKACT